MRKILMVLISMWSINSFSYIAGSIPENKYERDMQQMELNMEHQRQETQNRLDELELENN